MIWGADGWRRAGLTGVGMVAYPPGSTSSVSRALILMNLLDIVTPDCIAVPLAATDKRGIIDELVDLLAKGGKVTDAAALKEAVWSRELTRSTGIGLGLAIPHGKCAGVGNLAMAIGKP